MRAREIPLGTASYAPSSASAVGNTRRSAVRISGAASAVIVTRATRPSNGVPSASAASSASTVLNKSRTYWY